MLLRYNLIKVDHKHWIPQKCKIIGNLFNKKRNSKTVDYLKISKMSHQNNISI